MHSQAAICTAFVLHSYSIHIPFISLMFPPAEQKNRGQAVRNALRDSIPGDAAGLGNHSRWEGRGWPCSSPGTGAAELQAPRALQCCCFAPGATGVSLIKLQSKVFWWMLQVGDFKLCFLSKLSSRHVLGDAGDAAEHPEVRFPWRCLLTLRFMMCSRTWADFLISSLYSK